jgi:hypothetical protein
MPRTQKATTPSQFRLSGDTLAELDAIAAQLSADNGTEANRTDAVRYASRQAFLRLRKKDGTKQKKS